MDRPFEKKIEANREEEEGEKNPVQKYSYTTTQNMGNRSGCLGGLTAK